MKTSLAPGFAGWCPAYLEAAELQDDLERHTGSTSSATAAPPASATPARWAPEISKTINEADLVGVSVLSGNRNFEGRISPDVRAN